MPDLSKIGPPKKQKKKGIFDKLGDAASAAGNGVFDALNLDGIATSIGNNFDEKSDVLKTPLKSVFYVLNAIPNAAQTAAARIALAPDKLTTGDIKGLVGENTVGLVGDLLQQRNTGQQLVRSFKESDKAGELEKLAFDPEQQKLKGYGRALGFAVDLPSNFLSLGVGSAGSAGGSAARFTSKEASSQIISAINQSVDARSGAKFINELGEGEKAAAKVAGKLRSGRATLGSLSDDELKSVADIFARPANSGLINPVAGERMLTIGVGKSVAALPGTQKAAAAVDAVLEMSKVAAVRKGTDDLLFRIGSKLEPRQVGDTVGSGTRIMETLQKASPISPGRRVVRDAYRKLGEIDGLVSDEVKATALDRLSQAGLRPLQTTAIERAVHDVLRDQQDELTQFNRIARENHKVEGWIGRTMADAMEDVPATDEGVLFRSLFIDNPTVANMRTFSSRRNAVETGSEFLRNEVDGIMASLSKKPGGEPSGLRAFRAAFEDMVKGSDPAGVNNKTLRRALKMRTVRDPIAFDGTQIDTASRIVGDYGLIERGDTDALRGALKGARSAALDSARAATPADLKAAGRQVSIAKREVAKAVADLATQEADLAVVRNALGETKAFDDLAHSLTESLRGIPTGSALSPEYRNHAKTLADAQAELNAINARARSAASKAGARGKGAVSSHMSPTDAARAVSLKAEMKVASEELAKQPFRDIAAKAMSAGADTTSLDNLLVSQNEAFVNLDAANTRYKAMVKMAKSKRPAEFAQIEADRQLFLDQYRQRTQDLIDKVNSFRETYVDFWSGPELSATQETARLSAHIDVLNAEYDSMLAFHGNMEANAKAAARAKEIAVDELALRLEETAARGGIVTPKTVGKVNDLAKGIVRDFEKDPFMGLDADQTYIDTLFMLHDQKMVEVTRAMQNPSLLVERVFTTPDSWSFTTLSRRLGDETKDPTGFMNIVNDFTQLWRAQVVVRPGFSNRNFVGGLFTLSNDVPVSRMPELLNTATDFVVQGQFDAAKLDEFVKARGIKVVAGEQKTIIEQHILSFGSNFGYDTAGEVGLLPTLNRMQDMSRALGDFAEQKVEPYTNVFGNLLTGGKMAKNQAGVEQIIRTSHYLGLLEQGISPETAFQRVLSLHNDYTDLSKLDVTMKRIFPFWVWRSRNLPLQAHLLATSNYAGRGLMRVAAINQQRLEEEGDIAIPEWLPASSIPIANGFPGLGGILNPSGFSGASAVQDIAQSGNPLELINGFFGVDGVSPVIDVPLSLLSGNNLDTGQSYNPSNAIADLLPLLSEPVKTFSLLGTDRENSQLQGFDGRTSVSGLERLLALLGISTPDYAQ